LLAAFPDLDDDFPHLLSVGRFRASFSRPLTNAHLAIEGLDGVFAIPAKCVADLVDHRASANAIPTRIAGPAAFQIFDFALLTHDPGKCSHPGVILSGATTYFSFFLAGPPVSFNLAQCENTSAKKFSLSQILLMSYSPIQR
jgi:hypothetical protein